MGVGEFPATLSSLAWHFPPLVALPPALQRCTSLTSLKIDGYEYVLRDPPKNSLQLPPTLHSSAIGWKETVVDVVGLSVLPILTALEVLEATAYPTPTSRLDWKVSLVDHSQLSLLPQHHSSYPTQFTNSHHLCGSFEYAKEGAYSPVDSERG